ncbi:hypothetical protein [Agromyces seonyuensis]|uniref:Uncharacterized protein n=1 Tax=Agromyces seonyuensis TaxID=2662446 RepID=A0A6I4NY26_9MICO|nr:hypothetical protein [Agromyces seonyuensis]MWB99071.1 hypothetical protein [Agromyces seonyuensis]
MQTLITLIPVVTGAFLAAAFGLLGAWIQSRREHSRWLRERRFDAYTAALAYMDRLNAWVEGGKDPKNHVSLRRLLYGEQAHDQLRGMLSEVDDITDGADGIIAGVCCTGR